MSITEKRTIGENDEDHDGIQTIVIYILIGAAIIIVLTAIPCVVIKTMKRRITGINQEENENYGMASDFEQYHEQEENAKIEDTNDYYE